MKLQLSADSRQWLLRDADRLDAEGNATVIGYYGTLDGALRGALDQLVRSKSKRAREIEKSCTALAAVVVESRAQVSALADQSVAAIQKLRHDSELLSREKAIRSRKKCG